MQSPTATTLQRLLDDSGLSSSAGPIDEAWVARLLEEHYDVRGRLERLDTEKDDTFRLRSDSGDRLVKVSHPSESEEVVGLQTGAMRFLHNTAPELPVQRVALTVGGDDNVPVATGDGNRRVLRVFEYVEGVVLADADPDQHQLARVGAMLGRVDRALESYTHPAAARRLVWDLRHFPHLAELVAHTSSPGHRRLALEVLRLFERKVVPRLHDLDTQVIHGDYSPFNVVVDPHGENYVVGVIDFGDAVRSPLIFDPAVCVANLIGRTPDHPWQDAGAFMSGYDEAHPIKDSELPLVPVAALARLTLRALLTNWRAGEVAERGEYLLHHAKDDWLNAERAMAVPLDEATAQLRSGRPW